MDNGTMKLQTADPEAMACRDCLFRDRTEITMDGKKVKAGVMRDTCLVFDGKRGNWKPTGVVLDGEPCPLYEKEE